MKVFTQPLRGRASQTNPDNRFSSFQREAADDGWQQPNRDDPEQNDEEQSVPTQLLIDHARTVITRNDSPDVPLRLSINPYRGCEHGCAYCFARPGHAYLGLSPGLDFETKIVWKPDAANCLRKELAHPNYVCQPIALGINTDAYQPVERQLGLTRQILEVLHETRHPVSFVTKSSLIERDLDLLGEMGRSGLLQVMFSITTLDGALSRKLEPRAAQPQRRLQAMQRLAKAGVPVGVLVAPVIPAITDAELEAIVAASVEHGATSGGYILLRLPREVSPLFRDWLARHYPDRAAHVMSLMQQMHGGKDYDSRFGVRMRGEGPFADLLSQRFTLASKRHGLGQRLAKLDCGQFKPPRDTHPQAELF